MKTLVIPVKASFKEAVTISNLEKINLFFGYNGSGKTTISRVLDSYENTFVYNEDFIEDNFRNEDKQKGIFTIGKDAGDAKDKIKEATKEKEKLQSEVIKLEGNNDGEQKGELQEKKDELGKKYKDILDKLWTIKQSTNHSDSNHCLQGFRKDSAKLTNSFLNYFSDARRTIITKEEQAKFKTELEKRCTLAFNNNLEEKKTHRIPSVGSFEKILNDKIWEKEIIGNKENSLYKRIDELKNSDWVNLGKKEYLKDENVCPFCQEPLKEKFLDDLKSYFNEEYEKDINLLEEFKEKYNYSSFISSLKELLSENLFNETELELRISELEKNFIKNDTLIKKKNTTPSEQIVLQSILPIYKEIGKIVGKINREIVAYNKRIKARDKEQKIVKKDFWDYYTSVFSGSIEQYLSDKKTCEDKIKEIENRIVELRALIKEQDSIIALNQSKLTNIQTSINSINNSLLRNGFTSFKVVKVGEDSCRIVRNERSNETSTYKTLSEGEKTIISFLYFVELCKGTIDKSKEISSDRIIVIDDPISSLSHNVVFEISQIIRNEFLNIKKQETYNQLFLLTHNLYLFYEVRGNIDGIEKKINEQSETEAVSAYNTYKVKRNEQGSSVVIETDRKEVLTDYDVYWSIVKDCKCNDGYKALLPNAMRNILEYYFGFIKDEDNLNNALNGIANREFVRFINRNSHSDKQNFTFNVEEIDVEAFLSSFEEVFTKTRQQKHYKLKMN